MRGKTLFLASMLAALLLAGCTKTDEPEPKAADRERQPEALLVLFREMPGHPKEHRLLRLSLTGEVTTIVAGVVCDGRVAPDGHRFLYSKRDRATDAGIVDDELRLRDDVTGEDEAVLRDDVYSYGWAGARAFAVTAKSASPNMRGPGDQPLETRLHEIGTPSSTVLPSAVGWPHFLGGDAETVYLLGMSPAGPHGETDKTLWAYDRRMRRVSRLYDLAQGPNVHGQRAGERWEDFAFAAYHDGMPAITQDAVLGTVSVYEWATKQRLGYSRLAKLSVRRLSSGEEVRSLPATPLYSPDERTLRAVPWPVLNAALDRYLHVAPAVSSEPSADYWVSEVDARGGSTPLVDVEGDPWRTRVVGYVGDEGDFAYSVTHGMTARVLLHERGSGKSRELASFRLPYEGYEAEFLLEGIFYR